MREAQVDEGEGGLQRSWRDSHCGKQGVQAGKTPTVVGQGAPSSARGRPESMTGKRAWKGHLVQQYRLLDIPV